MLSTTLSCVMLLTRLLLPSRRVFCSKPPWATCCRLLPWLWLAWIAICTPLLVAVTATLPAALLPLMVWPLVSSWPWEGTSAGARLLSFTLMLTLL
ncbi:hypothetical protein D3C78_1820890 [compost metagenome]